MSATDASQTEPAAGQVDVVYKITLEERSLINAALTAPFHPDVPEERGL